MTYSKISIVTPSFNQGEYIERTIRSVLGQQYPYLEYLFLDGGSTDNTLTIVEPYKSKLSYFVSAPDGGQGDAIASGFERSTGEILGYLNSDDLLAPGALHFVNEFFRQNPRIDFIYSHRLAIDEEDNVIWYWILPRHVSYLMKRWDFIPQETCFWRRRLLDKCGSIDRSFRFAMDYDLFVRFMTNGRFGRVNRFLAAFRVHSGSKTSTHFATVGQEEFQKLWVKNNVRWRSMDGLLSLWYNKLPSEFGRIHANSRRWLPGSFVGVGYNFNEVWGGYLRKRNPTDSQT
jgi:glycosyltransferase involved in cell wall biosynthesis